MELITSRRNPLVGRLRALHQPKGRREQGLLLVEGTHQLQELLRLGLLPERVLATPDWLERHGALDRKSTRLNSSHSQQSRMPSSA